MLSDYSVFIQNDKGPLFRGIFVKLRQAKQKAEKIAKAEGLECFVLSFKTFSEVARFHPPAPKAEEERSRTDRPNRLIKIHLGHRHRSRHFEICDFKSATLPGALETVPSPSPGRPQHARPSGIRVKSCRQLPK